MKQKRNKPFYRARCGERSRYLAPAPQPEPPDEIIPYLAISYWNNRQDSETTPPDGCYVLFVG